MGQYLSSNSNEALNQLKYGKLNKFDLGLYQGQCQGVEWYLELESSIVQWKLQEENKKSFEETINNLSNQVYQAQVEGKVGSL